MAARNRPRASIVKEDLADEVQLWHSIVDKIRKCSAINRQYEDVAAQIPLVDDDLQDNNLDSIIRLDSLSRLHREGLKLSEEELKILNEEPDDLLKNLELLISVRAAFETETPRSATHTKSARHLKRRLNNEPDLGPVDSPAATTPDAATPAPPSAPAASRLVGKVASRSGSVAATSIKTEPIGEPMDGVKAVASDKYAQLKVNTQVFLRNKDKKSDGEGILCSVTSVIGDGKQRKYEVQDPEPDESGQKPAPYRAFFSSIEPIPPPTAILPDLQKGKQVIAVYPDTSTFYKAEVVGMRKEYCRLRFEGEEERDKEQDVERRFVLDVR